MRFEDICHYQGGLENQFIVSILGLDLDSSRTIPLLRFRSGYYRRYKHCGKWKGFLPDGFHYGRQGKVNQEVAAK